MIYITLAIYGQAIMGAVVEEKETRIAEILFSSARPFELMMGKLVGVGLAGINPARNLGRVGGGHRQHHRPANRLDRG